MNDPMPRTPFTPLMLARMLLSVPFTVMLVLMVPFKSFSQPMALGQWRAHLPFLKTKAVALAGDEVFCASDRGMFSFNKSDNSVSPMSKITGLSELDVSAIGHDDQSGATVIAYENANVDLIISQHIINILNWQILEIRGSDDLQISSGLCMFLSI